VKETPSLIQLRKVVTDRSLRVELEELVLEVALRTDSTAVAYFRARTPACADHYLVFASVQTAPAKYGECLSVSACTLGFATYSLLVRVIT
jgi:hypothetical protein